MFKFLKDRKKKDNKGFTLVELVIVVAILAILVGILAPQYTKYVEKSRKSADVSNLDNLVSAIKVAAADSEYSDIIPAPSAAGAVTKIEITVTSTGTEVKCNDAVIDNKSTGAAKSAFDALTEYASTEWSSTKLKSKSWHKTNGDKATPYIKATCNISETGAVAVTYDPTDAKDKAESSK